jgi:uncharacterized protein (TIGR02118 family)
MLRMTVLYPNADDASFDWDYYDEHHMALVQERFGPHFAKPPEVTKGVRSLPKGDATYLATAAMYFADQGALDAALQAGGMDIPNDIPNFTNARPVMQVDELV